MPDSAFQRRCSILWRAGSDMLFGRFFEPAKTAVCFMFWTCVASEEVLPTMILLSKWNIGKGAFKYIGLYRVAAS